MNTDINQEAIAKIAKINDEYRRGTKFTVTPGVQELVDFLGLIEAVREYKDFNEDNDPYGEHDFGSLTWDGNKLFWKIDYHDQELKYGMDPLDPACNRVLMIMLAEEY